MLDLIFIALMQAVIVADPAPSSPPAEQPATATPAADEVAPEDRMRCRMVRMQGSHVRERRCTSMANDETMNQATAREIREMQSQGGRGGDLTFGSGRR